MSDLRTQVQRMIDNGVPEPDIISFVNKWDSAPGISEHSNSRSAGVGVRGILQGAGGAILSVLNPAANAINGLAGGDPNYFKNPGKSAADFMGLPSPQNASEERANSVIEGVSSALPMLLFGNALQAGSAGLNTARAAVGSALTDMPFMQMASGGASGAAMQKAHENGLSPYEQIAAGVAGGISPIGLANIGRATGNSISRAIVNPEKAMAFRGIGEVPPSIGAISDSGAIQMLEGALGQGLTSAGVMKNAQANGQRIFENTVDNAAQRLAGENSIPSSLEAMGEAAASGATASKEAFRDASRQFENTVYAPLGQLSASLDNILQFIDAKASTYSPAVAEAYRARMLKELGPILDDATPRLAIQGKPITQSELQAQPYLQKMATEEPGGLNVASLRDWRRRIGERMDNPGTATTSDATQAELSTLYSNASKDIESALPPEGLAQVQGYNKWYSGESGIRKNVEDVFFGKKDSTATAKAILAADADQLAQLRHVVGDEVFNQLRASALKELSRGTHGLSPASALTKLSDGRTSIQPQVKDALFIGQDAPVRDIANALQGSRTFTNTSNTAGAMHTLQALGLGAGGVMSLPAAAGAAVAPYAAAKAVTSPTAINALIDRAFNNISVQPGNMLNSLSNPAKESYADMLRRYGVNITLGQ